MSAAMKAASPQQAEESAPLKEDCFLSAHLLGSATANIYQQLTTGRVKQPYGAKSLVTGRGGEDTQQGCNRGLNFEVSSTLPEPEPKPESLKCWTLPCKDVNRPEFHAEIRNSRRENSGIPVPGKPQ